MDFLEILKNNNIVEFKETKNYWFENHSCNDETIKINLDYTLSHYKTDKILRFGICKACGVCFYHYDYESK